MFLHFLAAVVTAALTSLLFRLTFSKPKKVTLNCLIHTGELLNSAKLDLVQITVLPSSSIGDVKLEMRKIVKKWPVCDITVWGVLRPPKILLDDPEENKRAIEGILEDFQNPNNTTELLSLFEVRDFFPKSPPKGCIHLIFYVRNATHISPSRSITTSGKGERVSPDFTMRVLNDFCGTYWGKALEENITTLPTLITEDDLLPGDTTLICFDEESIVRAEFVRTFAKVEKVYEADPTSIVVVTGHPGIGKSLWVLYAIRRCLGMKRPVVWYLGEKFYYFNEDGVHYTRTLPLQNSHTWCFVDSIEADRLPSATYRSFGRFFPIFVTSSLHKTPPVYHLIVMNPWTRAELGKAARLPRHSKQKLTDDEITKRFETAGPSARTCLMFSNKELESLYSMQRYAIMFNTPKHFLESLAYGDINICHKIFLVRRSEDSPTKYTVGLISSAVKEMLLKRILQWSQEERLRWIKQFSQVPSAADPAGYLFEAHYQDQFSLRIEITARPMFTSTDKNDHWRAPFGEYSNKPQLHQAQTSTPDIHITVSPKQAKKYRADVEIDIEQDVYYYVPMASNEPAIDAFIVHCDNLYMFQFTVSKTHTISDRLKNLLGRLNGLPPNGKKYLVFVVPKSLKRFECTQSDIDFLRDRGLYVAQVDDDAPVAGPRFNRAAQVSTSPQ